MLDQEELSPRGVDERGISMATSSDEEEDASVQATCEHAHTALKRRHESHEKEKEDPIEMGPAHSATQAEQWERQKICEGENLIPAEIEMESQECGERNFLTELLTAKQECPEPQSTNAGVCQRDGDEVQKHSLTERELNLEENKNTGKPKGGSWSRCPRCNSTDTKFCYFNNYNVNQPRHFCRHCQRYWTAGGTLRNVPVGAGKRKNKHALRKEAFFMSPLSGSNGMALLDVPMGAMEAVSPVKAEPVSMNVDLPVETGPESDSNYPIPEQSAVAEMPAVNTNLELSAVHGSTSSPRTPCIQTHSDTLSSHRPHSLTALKQFQMCLSSGSSPSCPVLALESTQTRQEYPNLASVTSGMRACDAPSEAGQIYSGGCSKFSQNCAKLSDGGAMDYSSAVSPLRSGSSANVQSGSLSADELSQIHPPLHANGSSRGCPSLQKRPCEANPNRRKQAELLPTTTDQQSSAGVRVAPSLHNSEKGAGLAQPDSSSLLPFLWPYLYNNGVAPPLIKPILTPHGWAFPFIPPCLQPSSSTTSHPPLVLHNSQSTHTISPLITPNTSTHSITSCRTPHTPLLLSTTPNFANVPFVPTPPTIPEDVPNRVSNDANASHGKRLFDSSNSCNYSDCHKGSKCSKSEC